MEKIKYRSKFELLFGNRLFTMLLLLLQFAVVVALITFGSRLFWLKIALTIFSIVTCLHLITRTNKHAFKIPWIILILLFPVFGGVLYWGLHFQTVSTNLRKSLQKSAQPQHEEFRTLCNSQKKDPDSSRDQTFLSFMRNSATLPIYQGTDVRYYPDGAPMLADMLADLKNAKRFIFMEYYIIEEGLMWNSILEILRERAAAGVDVRVMYDDLGSLTCLPYHYQKVLRSYGIKCEVFNRFSPRVTCFHNNRDHRKITVIDGKVAYTGGINLADEYINEKHLFGHWRDTAVRMEGPATESFTLMFLKMWNLLSNTSQQLKDFLPEDTNTFSVAGWVHPYTDNPLDKIHVGERIFLHALNRTQKRICITTPYLMIGDEIISALKGCVQSGIEVCIITPGIPDKKLIYLTTRSYYRELLESGVKIYEYTPGFIHSKTILSDDDFCVIGTSNMDYRSLYVNFECGACFYDSPIAADLKKDMQEIISLSREVTVEDCKTNIFTKLLRDICRMFAPLM